ncbi:MAG: hypothetical protein QMA93_07530, partial [Acidimicrobiales bacterium]
WCPIDIGFRDVGQGIGWLRKTVVAAERDPEDIPIKILSFSAPSAETIDSYADLGVSRVLFGAPDEADAHKRFVDRHQHLVDQFAT